MGKGTGRNISHGGAMLALALLCLGSVPAAAQPFAYASSFIGDSVSIVDTRSGDLVAAIAVCALPYGVALSPDESRLYVVCTGANRVQVIDTVTRSAVASIVVGAGPWEVSFSPDGSRAYVTNDKSVSVIDTAANQVVATFVVADAVDLHSVAVTADGQRLFVTDFGRGQTSILSASDGSLIQSVAGGQSAAKLSANGQRVYLPTHDGGPFLVVDAATGTIVDSISSAVFGVHVRSVAVDAAEHYAFLAHAGTARRFSILDLQTHVVADSATAAGIFPSAVALSSNERCFYVRSNGVLEVFNVKAALAGTNVPFTTIGVPSLGGLAVSSAPALCGGDDVAPMTHATASGSPAPSGWYSTAVDVALSADDGPDGSGVDTISYGAVGATSIPTTTVNANSLSFDVSAEGETVIAFSSADVAGNVAPQQTLTLKVDRSSPIVNCAAFDDSWHSEDVSVECTASDSVSGLARDDEGMVMLSTSIADGTETNAASTGARQICDVAGHCTSAGPFDGIKIDKRDPSIAIAQPQGTSYIVGSAVTVSYECTDAGSGIASCAGPVASGAALATTNIGTAQFSVAASDRAGNSSIASVNYAVGFGICSRYDVNKAHKSGSTVPVKLQLCDSTGANRSASSVTLTAISLRQVSTIADQAVEDSGSANPEGNFRYDAGLQGYIFNLSTQGLAIGTWELQFAVAGDPTSHVTKFVVGR